MANQGFGTPLFGPPPHDIWTFAHLIRTVNEPCTCSDHQPHLYLPGECSKTHMMIHQHHHDTRSGIQLFSHSYEGLHLAASATQYFSKPISFMTHTQQSAIALFKHLQYETDTFQNLGLPDAVRAFPRRDMLQLLQIYNDLFFFSALTLDVGWRTLPGGLLGQCSKAGGFIELSRTSDIQSHTHSHASASDVRAHCRLETLLHETIHAFLIQFACKSCPTHIVNVENADGHGRAFQMLASALERVVLDLFGLEMHLADVHDFTENWGKVRQVPSLCDAQGWNWLGEDRK
jgi:hypothetical protein